MAEPINPSVKRIKAPDFYRDKLLGNVTAVGETNYRKGIAEPKRDPIVAGIEAEPRYKDEMSKVLAEERRKKMLAAKTNMAEWGKYSGTFSDRLVAGITGRVGEVDKFWKGWTPVLEPHAKAMDVEPTATFAERKAKMIKNVDKLKEKKGTWIGKVS